VLYQLSYVSENQLRLQERLVRLQNHNVNGERERLRDSKTVRR
jgi:hypothetical protein